MTQAIWPQPLTRQEEEELEAQRIACTLLVRGCESALFEFHSDVDEDERSNGVGTSRRVGEILQDILGSWRETLAILRTVSAG